MAEREVILGFDAAVHACDRAVCVSVFTPRDASQEEIRAQIQEASQVEGCVPTPKLFRKNQDTLIHPLTRRQIPVFFWRAEFTKLEAQAALDRGEKLPTPPCRLGQN